MKQHRLIVHECLSGFEVQDTITGRTHWLGDGVDTLFTQTGKAMCPGTGYFRRKWEQHINATLAESLEAYFPDSQVADEFGATAAEHRALNAQGICWGD